MANVGSRSESSGRVLKQAVGDCLNELGETPEAVAGRLQAYGVQGIPGRADECPMARYLRAVIGSERTVGCVGVLEQRVRVTRRGLRLPFSVVLPAAVQAFVRSFDEGQYPALVSTSRTRQEEHLAPPAGDSASEQSRP